MTCDLTDYRFETNREHHNLLSDGSLSWWLWGEIRSLQKKNPLRCYTEVTALLHENPLRPSQTARTLFHGFSIAIQIRWKFCFTFTSILIRWWLQNFVHDTTAVLSWHVQKFVAEWRSFHRICIAGKKTLVKRAPGPCLNIKMVFPGMDISLMNVRKSWDSLIFIMGIHIQARQHLYIETTHWMFLSNQINTIPADALSLYVTRAWTVTINTK